MASTRRRQRLPTVWSVKRVSAPASEQGCGRTLWRRTLHSGVPVDSLLSFHDLGRISWCTSTVGERVAWNERLVEPDPRLRSREGPAPRTVRALNRRTQRAWSAALQSAQSFCPRSQEQPRAQACRAARRRHRRRDQRSEARRTAARVVLHDPVQSSSPFKTQCL